MKKQINYKVSGEEWSKAKDKAFAKVSKNAKVDGFRQGKVPRNVFEKKYGTGDIVRSAMEDLIDAKYGEIIVTEKLIPAVEPKLEIVSADDDGFEVNITIITDPEVKLGKYKELKVKKDKVEVTKEEIEHEVGHILDRFAELVSKDGAVEEGDTAIIDFKGFKDNEEFEGGSAEGYSLEIGSHSFIPGFEEGVVGMKKEESKDIKLTFPKDYMAKDLAGKEVVFNVTVHDIKKRVIPDLDEEFFKDLDMEGVTNKEELESLREELKKLEKEYNQKKSEKSVSDLSAFLSIKEEINGITTIITITNGYDIASLKQIASALSNQIGDNNFVLLANVNENNSVNYIAKATSNRINCGEIVKDLSVRSGGNGGGNKSFAQGGGTDATIVSKILMNVKEQINTL